MPLHEVDVINQFFSKPSHSAHVTLAVGDDAAITTVPEGYELVTSIDTMVENTHFFKNTPANDIGYKALAVSISDMAAMGAEPTTALLALTIPQPNKDWLTQFAHGLFECAQQYSVTLIGGDTTRGPLSITSVLNGFSPQGKSIRRSGAKPGDLIYVTGDLGDAGLAIHLIRDNQPNVPDSLIKKMRRPQPRVAAGILLRKIATSAIDISDGLATDLEKILTASQVSGVIEANKIPLSKSMQNICEKQQAWQYALTSGDDYELCFTIPEKKQQQCEQEFKTIDCKLGCIGSVRSGTALTILNDNGEALSLASKGYQAF